MSVKLEDSVQLGAHIPEQQHHQMHQQQSQKNQPQPSENMDILDEFLDRRLLDDPKYAKQANQHQLQSNDIGRDDEDMFSTFLTDEINKSEFGMFNNTMDTSMMDADVFPMPDTTMFMQELATPSNQAPQMEQLQPPQQHQQFQASMTTSTTTTPRPLGLTPPQQQEVFSTPTGTVPTSESRTSSVGFVGVPPLPPQQPQYAPMDSSFEAARNLLSQLKFGRADPAQFHNEFPKELLDIDASSLPYQLRVDNLPVYSRVETQIKLQLSVSPPPPEFLVHLPADTIAKQKLCLAADLAPMAKESMLFLDTYVLTSSADKPCNICSRCVRREQKRASRRKSGVSDNLNWMTNANKRAIIFNCKEVISFPAATMVNNSKTLEISSRIVCYCRHHNESKGFKLLMVLKNARGQVVAKHISSPIMIMDRKKSGEEAAANGVNTASNSATEVGGSTTSRPTAVGQPISPTSFEEDSSEPHTSDSRVFKRKRTWSPELSDGFSIAPSRKPSNNLKNEPVSPQSQASVAEQPSTQLQFQPRQQSIQTDARIPVIQRVIPAQGPLRGGIEVTLLGSNFKQGLTVKFGVNKALSTQCWSDTTMVTYLPPASQPGQVVVTIVDPQNPDVERTGNAVFLYLDDTDRQMIELALQIVGLKMNGKLEDARNIARKIIGSSEGAGGQETQVSGLLPDSANNFATTPSSDEDLILKVINRLPSKPNWALCTSEGQTLLHLSALKGYSRLVSSMLHKGARADYRDVTGYTPLHYASLAGDRKCIELLLNCKAKIDAKTDNGLTPLDIADPNVLDMLTPSDTVMSRKLSSSSMSSIFSLDDGEIDFHGGLHVSRLTTDHLTDGNDSEAYDSDSSAEASNEESESDWADERESSIDSSTTDAVPPVAPTGMTDGLWNKVRNVFQNTSDQEDLPRYDELFPLSAKQFSLPKLRFSASTTSTVDSESRSVNEANSSSDESEDVFMKFFNQRKNVQNDKMLFFFWLPLLIVIMSVFILTSMGYTIDSFESAQSLVRQGVGKIMLGNERVKVALNRHFSNVNDAVTSVINAS